MNKVPMTVFGAEKLKDELQHLKSTARPEVINAIAEARAHGDLKENAEYAAAKERQSFIEGRIQELEGKLSNAQVIDIQQLQNEAKIVFGATVTLVNTDTDEHTQYQIVGEDEADVKTKKVSINSPIARAMISKEAGDEVIVQAPGGTTVYEVARIQYL